MPKKLHKVPKCATQKMPPKSAKLRHYSLSRQNSVKFCKDLPEIGYFYTKIVRTFVRYSNSAPHPSLEGIGTPWVCDPESRQHPVSLETKPDKMTVAILNLYGSFLSSSTHHIETFLAESVFL